jgi:hypothetical protein
MKPILQPYLPLLVMRKHSRGPAQIFRPRAKKGGSILIYAHQQFSELTGQCLKMENYGRAAAGAKL